MRRILGGRIEMDTWIFQSFNPQSAMRNPFNPLTQSIGLIIIRWQSFCHVNTLFSYSLKVHKHVEISLLFVQVGLKFFRLLVPNPDGFADLVVLIVEGIDDWI
jgi:hypothetical protein